MSTLEARTVSTNPFWAAVCRCDDARPPASVEAPDLRSAAAAAFAVRGPRFGFRRPRELVDLDGRFRHFVYGGRTFVGKRTSRRDALHEVLNSRRARRRLAGSDPLVPLVPLPCRSDDATERLLLTEDVGTSLAHQPADVERLLPWEHFVDHLRLLVDLGIEWPGFLPRNIIARDHDQLVLIDWESCRFEPPGSRVSAAGELTLLFWSIAWAGHYGYDPAEFQAELSAILDLVTRPDSLDDFELTYASMAGPQVAVTEVRRRCSEATMATEAMAPVGLADAADPTGRDDLLLTGADVGHLINELLPAHLSVLYTFASYELLQDCGEPAYTAFVGLVIDILVLCTPCEGLEGQPARRRQLLLMLLVVLIAVLLDRTPPVHLRGAVTTSDLVARLRKCSATAAGLLDIEQSAAAGSLLESSPVTRFLELSALRLGLAGVPRTTGLLALGHEVIGLVSVGGLDRNDGRRCGA